MRGVAMQNAMFAFESSRGAVQMGLELGLDLVTIARWMRPFDSCLVLMTTSDCSSARRLQYSAIGADRAIVIEL
jgi:hypothetical protein